MHLTFFRIGTVTRTVTLPEGEFTTFVTANAWVGRNAWNDTNVLQMSGLLGDTIREL